MTRAQAIAERMRPYTAVYDLVSDMDAGVFDDLLNPPDSWWRMVAIMRERLRVGESVASVAADYRTPENVVAMLVDRVAP